MMGGLGGLLDGVRLSPAQRRIALYLSEHLDEAIFLSSVELAERAGVSQPSVTRFAVALGFAGYPELRQALRPLVLGRTAGEPGLIESAIDGEIRNLGLLRSRLDGAPAVEAGHGQAPPPPLRIKEAGEALAAADPLPIFGLRVSAGLATTLGYYARLIHPDVRLFTHGGSELLDGLRIVQRAGAQWVLAVVLPRYPAESIQALEYADKLGLRRVVITDRPGLPADITLDAPVGDRLVFDSHAAPLAVAMALVEAMADAAPLRTQARLEDYERSSDEAGIFLPGEPP
ncbi:DNA-binding MurR/RpiR family transcriptional regulator [Nonomuraea soli]|uniref:DNA-binding MurR/RpiR family transcriptional regulator n=2 Tax=Nonomuraea soli TaxID=1032476 RepID=A0A7W0HRP5_9ACTN|nr:DNA-binding MurR/RpiR family transcriptional regulator [Nonomuraea soli]